MTWTLVHAVDAPASNIFDIPSLTLTGLKVIEIVVAGVVVATDDSIIRLTFYVGGVEIVTGYRWGGLDISSGASALDDGDASDPSIVLNSDNATWGVGNAASEHFNTSIVVDQPISTALYKRCEIRSAAVAPSGNVVVTSGQGLMENTGAIQGFKIAASSNITAGKVRVLGLT
jgi:hypothetical protein